MSKTLIDSVSNSSARTDLLSERAKNRNPFAFLAEKVMTFVKSIFKSFSFANELELYFGKTSHPETYTKEQPFTSPLIHRDIGTENLPEVQEVVNASDREMKRMMNPEAGLDALRLKLINEDRNKEYREDNRVRLAEQEHEQLSRGETLAYENAPGKRKPTGSLLLHLSPEDRFELSAVAHAPISRERVINSLDTMIRKETVLEDRLSVAAILISKNKLSDEEKTKLIRTLSVYKDKSDTTNYNSLLDIEIPSWDAAPLSKKREAEEYLQEAFSRGEAPKWNLIHFGSNDGTLFGGLTDKEQEELMQAAGQPSFLNFLCTQILSANLQNESINLLQLKNYLKKERVSIDAEEGVLLTASKQLMKEIEKKTRL